MPFSKKAFSLEGGLCEGGSFVNLKKTGFKDFKIVGFFVFVYKEPCLNSFVTASRNIGPCGPISEIIA